jgi:hypothetical protein
MVTLILQGGTVVDLDESEKFNKIRHRLNQVSKMIEDYKLANIDGTSTGQKYQPFHVLSFKTVTWDDDDDEAEPVVGRVSVHFDKIVAVTSDEERDVQNEGPIGKRAAAPDEPDEPEEDEDDEDWDDDDEDED